MVDAYEEAKALFYQRKNSSKAYSESDSYDCRNDDPIYDDDDADCVCG